MSFHPAPYYGAFECQAVSGSTAFGAMLSTADATLWEVAATTTHAMRYRPGAVTLANGDSVSAEGSDYKVTGTPRRITADEMQAELVRQ